MKELCSVKNRYEVTVFDVRSSKTIKKLKHYNEEITIVYGDLRNDDDLIKMCYNQDAIIHLAAIIPPLEDEKPELSYQINVKDTKKLINLLELHSLNAFLLYRFLYMFENN